uniref:Uncharacterized protein n=1 Tax=Chromera velia CCMP2878 TaxID=1169474 RepID=A0A0G4HGD8_9ALVE|eukprot:Cvel_27357.t1-p1 / transcript=Cvel_27357.t1 / gene=Cvel_27357 / organism=Chromera_velia_CCMP2878 / gene_product=Ankyrin-1, putative / transcript_product=Ankyrin-1, putative / location=Cvel_scaffold3399:9477-14771(-) / protein_length=1174 / sequence_SO=supercontig / SO=protein_coding / is_pseudo=false
MHVRVAQGLPSLCGRFRVEQLACRETRDRGGGQGSLSRNSCTLDIVCVDSETETEGKGKGVEASAAFLPLLTPLQSESLTETPHTGQQRDEKEEGILQPHQQTPHTPAQPPPSSATSHSQNETQSAILTEGLLTAARNGNATAMEALLSLSGSGEAGGGVQTRDPSFYNNTLLHIAAANGHTSVVTVLLAAGADMEEKEEGRWTPLHWAAFRGHVGVASALVAAGAEVEAIDDRQFTPLHLAAQKGNVQVASALLAAGAEVEARADSQFTALHLAAQNGHVEVVSALVAAGADVQARADSRWTPLHVAAFFGHVGVASALVAAGAEVEARDDRELTPLHFAAQEGHVAVISALVSAGAEVEARNNRKRTPLHLAALKGHEAVVSPLVAAGAGLEARDDTQRAPLHLAALKGHIRVVAALVAEGAQLEARADFEFTPLHFAAAYGHEAVVLAAVQYSTDIHASRGGGRDPVTGEETNRTALFMAAIAPQQEGSEDISRVVHALLQNGADLRKTDYENATVLQAVAGSCEVWRTQAVLRQAARDGVFLSDIRGERDGRTGGSLQWTVLHTAAKKNCANLVPLFLEQQGGSQLVTREDAHGLTALHVAARFGSADVVSAFLEGGQFDVESRTGPASESRTAFHLAAEGSSESNPSFRGEGYRLAKSFSLEEQMKTLRVLATHKASATAVDARGLTPLHAAAQAGRAGAVGFLVDAAGVDVNISGRKRGGTEEKGVTPLMLAVRSAHRETVGALLQRNASLFDATERGQTPLHFAAVAVPPPNTGGQGVLMVAEMARRLVKAIEGPSLRVRALSAPTRDWRAEKPLHLAVRSGSAELVRALVQEEVEARRALGESETVALQRTLESPDGRLQTRLLAAASEGRVNVLSILVLKGARVGVKGEGGKSLLHLAVESGFVEVVRLVLSISDGSKPGKEDGRNAFIATAEERGEGGKAANETIGQNPRDWSGASPLHSASSLGREDIVALLCDNGAEPNSERADAVTPLLLAARRGSLSVIRRLASYGARGVAAVLVDPSVPTDSLSLLKAKNETERQPGGLPDRVRRLSSLSLIVGEEEAKEEQEGKRKAKDDAVVRALHTVSAALESEGKGLCNSAARVDEEPGEGRHGTALQVAASQGLSGTAQLLLQWGASLEGRSRSASPLSAVSSLPPLLLAASGG